jgi:hypothetical protein
MGQPIVVTSPQPIPILTIERYEPNFDASVILNYVNRINSTPFWSAPPWTALMAGISDEQAILNGIKVRRVSYTIKFKIDEFGWRLVLLNEGGKCRKLVSSEPKNAQSEWSRAAVHTIKDMDGNPTTGVLDWYGYQLGAGPTSSAVAPDFVPVTSEMVPTIFNGGYLVFDQFPVINLNALQLGPWVIPRIP